ncbi:segregation/condensation protein A [Streptomyces maoxianensis]|uniref:Segregation and condensation protein A n=1 Tax=Streptomyces maoxianensis TaxID=1459942 RepID=A0ABV9GIQ9_9ACTN
MGEPDGPGGPEAAQPGVPRDARAAQPDARPKAEAARLTVPVQATPSDAPGEAEAAQPDARPKAEAARPDVPVQAGAAQPDAPPEAEAAQPDGLPGVEVVQGVPAGPAVPAEPAVPDGRFKVRLANFEGPFDLLLQLISKHKLDVTEVALSKVTDEFMSHIRAMGDDWDLDQTTEFLVVAATLLDLKAARLLPTAEVEDEADLALLEARDLLFARLLQYRAYKQIAEIFNTRLEEEGKRYPRTVGLEAHHAELLPEVVISIGAEGFAKLAVKAMQPRPRPQVYVDHIHAPLVSVREQAEVVVARLRKAGAVSFRELAADAPDTLTVVARFLALLELYRDKAVVLEQDEALGELMVKWTGGEAGATVTDEFDSEVRENQEEEKA